MSIKHMSLVWEHSKQKGTALLLLLAIADFANDEGVAWPSRKSLADRIRMGESYVKALTQKIILSKELRIIHHGGSGAGDSHKYKITIKKNDKGEPDLPLTKGEPDLPLRVTEGSLKGRQSDNRPSLNPLNPTAAPATASAAYKKTKKQAAAAAVEGKWSLVGLLATGKVHKQSTEAVLAANVPPAAFVANYLYGLASKKIHSPALFAAKRVITDHNAGRPFDPLAQSPAMLNEVLTWLESGQPYSHNLNGLMGDALAFRGHLITIPDWQERLARARLDLGLEAAPAAEPDPEPEPAPEKPKRKKADEWQAVIEKVSLLNANHPALDRLRRCRLVSVTDGALIIAAPSEAEKNWLVRSMAAEIAHHATVEFIVKG